MLSGKICSGKDYVADILVKKFDFRKYAFADILKKEVSESCNIDIKYFITQEGKSEVSVYGKTHRELLIDHAKYKKLFNKNYYTSLVLKELRNEKFNKVVISDFRYPYEYSFLRENLPDYEIKTIYVERDSCVMTNLSSERALEDFEYHYLIDNNKGSDHIVQQLSMFRT
jgi:hypothetical protein